MGNGRGRDGRDAGRALVIVLLVQAALVLLAGANLAWDGTRAPTSLGEYVRWRELFSLSVVLPASAAAAFAAMWILECGRADAAGPLALFAVAVCVGGVSMGVHEPLRALPLGATGRFEPTLRFWVEIYSHATFFLAYAGLSVALLWSQGRNPLPTPPGPLVRGAFAAAGVVGGAGMYLSLVRGGVIRVDMLVIVTVIVLAELTRRGRSFALLPIHLAMELACALGLGALLVTRGF